MSRKKVPLNYQMIRGSLGKELVIKRYSWGVIMTKFPDMSGIIASAKQRSCRNVFKEAVAYAKAVIADPVKKAEWRKRIKRKHSVYNKAITAYMHKAKADQQREALLIEQKVRLAFKNESDINGNKIKPTEIVGLPGIMVAENRFMETG